MRCRCEQPVAPAGLFALSSLQTPESSLLLFCEDRVPIILVSLGYRLLPLAHAFFRWRGVRLEAFGLGSFRLPCFNFDCFSLHCFRLHCFSLGRGFGSCAPQPAPFLKQRLWSCRHWPSFFLMLIFCRSLYTTHQK